MLQSKVQTLVALLTVAIILFLIGCSNGRSTQEVDTFLKEYETRVAKWEAKAQARQLSLAELQQIQQETEPNLAKIKELGVKYKWSDVQAEQLKALSARMQKVALKNIRNPTPVTPR